MKEDWNYNDYQGRSRDRMERNYRIFALLFGMLWIIGAFILTYTTIKGIFE